MNINDVNGNRSTRLVTAELVAEDSVESPHYQPPFPPEPEMIDGRTDGKEAKGFATRADLNNKPGMERSKVILLGGGLLIAVLFFVFTAIVRRSHSPRKASEKQSPQQQKTDEHKGSVTPLMEAVRKPAPDNAAGQLGPADIKRTRSSDGGAISQAYSGLAEKAMGYNLQSNDLRNAARARNMRDFAATTEVPVNSAISIRDISCDRYISITV
jgi:hypothetical protein